MAIFNSYVSLPEGTMETLLEAPGSRRRSGVEPAPPHATARCAWCAWCARDVHVGLKASVQRLEVAEKGRKPWKTRRSMGKL